MATRYWKDEPWATDPKVLLTELEKTYTKALKLGKIETVAKTTLKKAVANRGWHFAPDDPKMLAVVEDLGMIYVPQGLEPGPGFLFPIRDVTGDIKRAHIRLITDDQYALYGGKYLSCVDKHLFIGPPWLGNDEATLEAIIQTGEVIVMEGPFDLAAIRYAAPQLPSLCSLTKRLGKLHWAYLKILGVQRVYIMFDEEKSGRGEEAANVLARRNPEFEITRVVCPAHDPSDALRSSVKAQKLRDVLSNLSPKLQTTLIPID